MGKLDSYVDLTGTMSTSEVNAQNISNIIDESNRNSDQLDAISNSLNITAKGTISGTWNGVGGIGAGLTLSPTHGFQTAPIFIAFYSRSDRPGQYYPVPNWEFDNSGSLLSRAFGLSIPNTFFFNFAMTNNGTPLTITFSWYSIQQPALVPTGS